jgi:hypothetical protein
MAGGFGICPGLTAIHRQGAWWRLSRADSTRCRAGFALGRNVLACTEASGRCDLPDILAKISW